MLLKLSCFSYNSFFQMYFLHTQAGQEQFLSIVICLTKTIN